MQQSKYASDFSSTRFLLEIPHKSIRNRQVVQFKIKFENNSTVSELLVLKNELRLLEMAAIVPISLGVKENIVPRRESAMFLPQRQMIKSPTNVQTPKKSAMKSPASNPVNISITSSIAKQITPTDLSRLLENLKKKKNSNNSSIFVETPRSSHKEEEITNPAGTPKWKNDMAYLPSNYMRESPLTFMSPVPFIASPVTNMF